MVVKTLAFIGYLSITSFSQMAPFYPLEAKEAGVDVYWVGFVLGTNAAFFMMTPLIIGKYLTWLGRERALFFGIFLIMTQ